MSFLQQIADGITSGSIYGALALALVLVYRSTGLVNFAQGQMAVVSTYLAYTVVSLGLPIIPAVLVAAVASALLGGLLERYLIRRFEGGSQVITIIVTVAVLICLNGLIRLIWGAELKPFPSLFPTANLAIGPVFVTASDVGVVAALVVIVIALQLLFHRSRFGLAMRAVAENPESSAQSGLPVGTLLMSGWALAAVVGAIAGCLVAPTISLHPDMMDAVLVYALAAAVLGGLDSPLGAVFAAWVIGIAQNLAGTFIAAIGSDLQILVPMLLMAVVLLVRPQGLFGRREVVRV
ncbi:branched-chain amino acid ABC transporter permease [Pseudonocardia sp. GCM10023141]|uniref:branched-chain amino acid ABC transporter permease n=1 Tax=Pseudonocardia sp. GCM10023141 TaxID=3252653 RepID=UPI0036240268